MNDGKGDCIVKVHILKSRNEEGGSFEIPFEQVQIEKKVLAGLPRQPITAEEFQHVAKYGKLPGEEPFCPLSPGGKCPGRSRK